MAASRAASSELTRAALGEQDVVVRADLLLSGDNRGGAGVAFDGGMGAQYRLELHAPGHGEHG